MEGFLRIRMPPWLRRLSTRLVAVVPAAIVAGVLRSHGLTLLCLCQPEELQMPTCWYRPNRRMALTSVYLLGQGLEYRLQV